MSDDQGPTSDAGRNAKDKPVDDAQAALARLKDFTRRIVRVPVKDVRKLEKTQRRRRKR